MSKVVTSSPTTPSASGTHGAHGARVPHDKIAMRAHEKWCKRGRPHGTDKQDWLEAETELCQELGHSSCSTPHSHPQARR